MSLEVAKKAAAEAALEFIEDGMIVGLGTGSSANYFIKGLGKKCSEGLKIKAIASSTQSYQLAKSEKIVLINIDQASVIDVTVDGTDEIDPKKRLIKGAGGALLFEKILASSSREMIIIADETKMVEKLGKRPLPIEVIPFGAFFVKEKLEKLKFHGKWRTNNDGSFFITESKNYIFDIEFDALRDDPERDQLKIINIPGVVETGFFFGLATRALIADMRGIVKNI